MSTIAKTSVNFGVIDIDAAQVAQILHQFVSRGSKTTGVSLDDLDLRVKSMPTDVEKSNLVILLTKGLKLFDAIVWLQAQRPATHPLKEDRTMEASSIPNLNDIARSVFYVYFFLLTQARYPVSGNQSEAPKVPAFLRNIMGMDADQGHYIKMICSFTPQKFSAEWVRHVSFGGFGQEALSRFGLGVAGYRLFAPFKAYEAKSDISPALATAVKFAATVARHPPTWAIHPLTRNPAVLTKRGNLNKNLSNLILEVFTTEQIQEMVGSKMLYAMPTHEPNYRDYRTWNEADDISGSEQIFPRT